MVRRHAATSDGQNPHPCRNRAGISRNIGSDGNTYQNVALAWSAMLATSGLSRHSQIMPSTDTSGSEATSAPNPALRLAISDTAA